MQKRQFSVLNAKRGNSQFYTLKETILSFICKKRLFSVLYAKRDYSRFYMLKNRELTFRPNLNLRNLLVGMFSTFRLYITPTLNLRYLLVGTFFTFRLYIKLKVIVNIGFGNALLKHELFYV